MQGDKICPHCGQMIPRGTTNCPICAKRLGFNLRRETLLLVCIILLGILSTVTVFAVKLYHAREKSLAEEWYAKGEANLKDGKPQEALTDFRTALYHAQGDAHYQLRLAQALVKSGRLEEARTYLLRLWENNPADGPVNLALARLAEREGKTSQVISYYHNAIDGVWENASDERRRAMRQALCEYLIAHDQRSEALAELMALSAATPNDPKLRAQVAELFLKAQDYDSALKEFRQALRLNRKQPGAWAGAGKAAFKMGDYRTARSDLERALAEDPKNEEAAHMLDVADHVLEINPFDRLIPVKDRRRRVILAFQHALARLQACARSRGENLQAPNPQTGLQKAFASAMKLKPQVNEQAFRRNPDLQDSAMGLVFQIEQTAAQECGPPQGVDLALLLIASKNGGAE